MLIRYRSITNNARSLHIRAAGGVGRPSAPNASRKELLVQKAAAARSQAQQRLLALLVTHCPRLTVEEYLRGMADND